MEAYTHPTITGDHTVVKGTYCTHKNLYISLFSPTIFWSFSLWPPAILRRREVSEARRLSYLQQAVRVPRNKKTKRKHPESRRAQNHIHHRNHGSPATPTALRRRATKHAPRVSPNSAASSVNAEFCGNRPQTGLAISDTANKMRTAGTQQTGNQADWLDDGRLYYASRYGETFLPAGKARLHFEEAFRLCIILIGKKMRLAKRPSVTCQEKVGYGRYRSSRARSSCSAE